MGKKKKSKRGTDGKSNGWTTYDIIVGQPQQEDRFKLLRIQQSKELLI
jgi:hypothetical protein